MSNEQTTLNLDNVDLSGFSSLDQPMSAEDVLREQKKTQLNATMSQAIQTNPQQQAKLNNLSRQSGIPVPAVESDVNSVESHLKLKNIDLTSLVNDNPVTAGYLSDYNNAAIAHNDIDTLKGIESIMNPKDPKVELPFNTLRGVGGRISALMGGLADFVDESSKALDEVMPSGMFTMVGGMPLYLNPEQTAIIEKAQGGTKLKGFAEELKAQDFGYIPASTWESTKESFTNDGVISGIGEALSFGIESTIVSTPDMAAAAFALPAYILARSNEMGDERAKNKGLKEATIKETFEAMPFAIGSSLLEAILPAKIFKGMSKTEIEKVGQEILEGATSKVREVLSRSAEGMIIEASTEAVQEGIIEYIGERYGTDAPILAREMLDRGLGGAVGGGIGGSVLAGGVEAINVNRKSIEDIYNRWMTRKADAQSKEQMRLQMLSIKEQRDIDGINAYATNSELRELDPEAFRQFIDQSDGDKDLQVFIDGVQTRLYLSENQDMSDPVIAMLSEKANEAAALGTDVAIPIADFATVMAGTPHFDALRDSMTMNGDTTAPFRQEQSQEQSNEYIRSLMDEAQESVSEYVEAQDIFNSVREQLIDTGRVGAADATVMAQLVPAWATVFAKRNGLTIKQAYEQSGLIIEGPQTGEAARLAAEAEQLTQSQNQVSGQEFAAALSKARKLNPNAPSVAEYDASEYDSMDTYTLDDGNAGYAIEDDGNLVGVFKSPESSLTNALGTIVPEAIANGATKLNAFDGFLVEQYEKYGFVEVARDPWNEQYRPDGWTDEMGTPDVVYMELQNEQDTGTDEGSLQDQSGVRRSEADLQQRAGEGRRELSPLQDAPSVEGVNGPIEGLVRVAEQYAIDNGIDLNRQGEYVEVDPERATRIAEAYEQMENAPNDPVVREAYENLIEQTKAQYEALVAAGYQFWFVDLSRDDNLEYISSPWNSMRDIAQNKQMGVFPTDEGFGTDEAFDPSKNPLLADTGIQWPSGGPDGEMKTVYANDLFRAVHDAFGHGMEGAGFRARGEENAWQAHVRLFTGSAVGAITSETRGQNSWVNYGPSGEQNQTASAEDTVFADQKVGLMPEWTWTEGRASDDTSGLDMSQDARMQRAKDMGFDTENVFYHGTKSDIEAFDNSKTQTRDAGYIGQGTYLTGRTSLANFYAKSAKTEGDAGANVIPVLTRVQNTKTYTLAEKGEFAWDVKKNPERSAEMTEQLKAEGYDSAAVVDSKGEIVEMVVFDPSNIRSVNAKFEPEQKSSPELLAQTIDQTETEEFKNWSDNGEVVESYDVNDYDFKADTPVVLKVFHGTTHRFSEFDASEGNKEGQFGAVNYFTSSEMDASENYAGEGPDLTNRIEQRSERLEDELGYLDYDEIQELAEEYGLEFDPETETYPEGLPAAIAKRELSGGDEILMELFVRLDNPFVIGGDSNQWVQLREEITDEELYQQAADDTGEDVADIEANPDDYEDAIDEARWSIEADRESPLAEAIDTIARRYDLSAADILADFDDIMMEESVSSTDLEQMLRHSEQLSYSEDPETGEMISSQVIGEVIRELGYDSIVLKNANDRFKNMTMESGTAHVHIFDSNNTNIKSVDNTGTFDPTNPDIYAQNQGVTKGYYSPSESAIRLTEASDLSTFLHEFAHFMYEMELTNTSNSPDALNTISSIHNWYKRNAEDVAKEAGDYAPNTTIIPRHVVAYLDNGTAGDTERDEAIRRAVHEQFARGFETYLMEGKAPSIELRNVFRTFARWLTQIYRSLTGIQKVKLDDEMRQVFDRLLATEEQINAAEARAQYAPMFTDAAMAGMTEEEFIKYKKRQEKVKDKQTETLRDQLIKQLTRQTEAWWKDELADEVEVQTEALKTEQVYRAREALKNGDIKLDHATTKELIGENVEDKRGRKSRRIPSKLNGMTAKGALGVHPDEAAALLGYGSGDQMLKDLVDAVPIAEKADAQAEAAMIQRHGDMMHDGTIEQLADEALLNEERGALILQELKALSKGTKAPTIDRMQLKAMAENSIGNLAYKDIHPAKYRKAEIRAAQEAAVALKDGDKEAAVRAKTRQAMNFYLNKAATEARNDTMKIVERMARYNKKTVKEAIMRAENGYWEQIVKILGRFEFRKSATVKGVDLRNQDINSWMQERVETDGDALVLTPEILDEMYITHWKNVPYEKLKGINDSVKNLEHVARYANKIKTMGEEIEFKKLVSRWVGHMSKSTKSRFKSQRTDVAEGKNWGRWAMAQMTKIPFLASWLDGGERGGMSFDILVQPFTDAQAEEVKLWKEVGQPVMDLIEGRSKADIKRHNTKVFIPELVDENNDGNLYGNQIVAVALNVGNAGNLRKMLLGEGWANADDESEINIDNPKLQAVLKRMTKADWDLVQTIWDRMELLYPQLAEVHRRTTGLTPPKVEAVPVQTPFGEYKGGYYPVKYDPNRSQRAQENEDRMNAQVDSMFSGGASIQASVTASATNERTKYFAPIRLHLDVVPSHFQESIHFITHHDAVRQVNKLIRNPEVANMIKEKLGPEEYAQLKPWLNDIAKDGREAATKFWWEDMIGRLRFGITLGSMGFKASTGIMQFLGLSNIVAEVGAKHTYQAFREILGSPATIKGSWDFASSNSKILSNRVNSMDREIKNAMSRINSQINIKSGSKAKDVFYRFDNSNMLKTVQEASMKHIAYIQTYMVDLPTWYAAYIKEMELSGDEAKAYKVADFTVENLQGSGSTKDMAAIMRTRNETTRMLTMFMTFFSALWNLNRDVVKGAASKAYSPTTVAAKLMFLITVPVALEMLMRGELGDEDDDEEFQKFLTKTALYPVASVPFVRDIASGTIGEFGYNISPVASLIEQGTNSIPELIRRPFTDEEITKGQVKGASKFIAAGAGLPGTGQAWATGEHLYKVLEEGEDFTVRELLFGPKKEK